jgi:mRNA interferase MazF
VVSFPRRGEIFWASFDPVVGSERAGTRPALVVQNDVGNRYARTTIVVPLTTNVELARFPFAVRIPDGTLSRPSVVVCGQLRHIDKSRLSGEPVARLDSATMAAVDDALRAALGLY